MYCFNIFFITTLILKYFFHIHIYNEIYILILSWFILSYLSQYILKKRKIHLKTLRKIDSIHYIIGLLFMTGVFYYTGGILWIGAIFYVFTILYVSLLSTPKEGLIITFMAITFFSLIVFLEYLSYIPHKEIIKFTPYLYKDIQYIIGTILVISLVFIFIFLTGKDFAQMLKQKK